MAIAPVNVDDQDDGKDFGPLRIMNPNARRFTIVEVDKLPGRERFNGKDITWLVSFDVRKETGETRPVAYKVKIKQRDSEKVYVIKKGNSPAELLDEDEVLLGDPAVGITTK